MTKEKIVAVIFESGPLTHKSIERTAKLEHRIQRAIEDMIDDGFRHFTLPIIEHRPQFPAAFIYSFECVKRLHPDIHLTMMLLYRRDNRELLSPAENFSYLTDSADQILYNQDEYLGNIPTRHIENLLAESSALIIYYEKDTLELRDVTSYAHRNRLPIINIKI